MVKKKTVNLEVTTMANIVQEQTEPVLPATIEDKAVESTVTLKRFGFGKNRRSTNNHKSGSWRREKNMIPRK